MKKLRLGKLIVTAIIFGVFAVASVVSFYIGLGDVDPIEDVRTNGGVIFNKDYGTRYEDIHKQLDMTDVETVNIEWGISTLWTGGVNVSESADNDIHLFLDGTLYSFSKKEIEVELSRQGNTVTAGVDTEKDWMHWFPANIIFFAGDIEIQIPEDFGGTLNITVVADTLNIDIPDIRLGALNIEMSSGEINITDITVDGNINIELSSGTVECDKMKAYNINIDASSGTIICDSIEASVVTAELSSGTISLSKIVCGKLDIKLSSGTVNLQIPSSASYKVTYKISSGKLKDGGKTYEDSGSYTVGSGAYMIVNIKMSSGKCNITRS